MHGNQATAPSGRQEEWRNPGQVMDHVQLQAACRDRCERAADRQERHPMTADSATPVDRGLERADLLIGGDPMQHVRVGLERPEWPHDQGQNLDAIVATT